jgi:hypothetical protein
MKKVVVIALAFLAQNLASCDKATLLKSAPLPAQTATSHLILLQNDWLSSEAVMIPYYGDSSYGWFGNYVFPYSLAFNKNGTAVTYNSEDLTDYQWYDSCTYRLLADDSTLVFYPISGVSRQSWAEPMTEPDTAKIGIINDSTLVLYYFGTKTACVSDAFHR